jgi:hypothetical protein
MNTITLDRPAQLPAKISIENNASAWNKFIDFADGQSKNRTAWFLLSLLFQGVLLLPVPAALMYYYNAPIYLLAITMIFFFANIIAGMGGSSIRVLITLFGVSILVHLLMIAAFIF